MNNCMELLWSGGMDSTYRLLELSRRPVNIRPVYVCATNKRGSEFDEMTAMNHIYGKLAADRSTVAELLPIRVVSDDHAARVPIDSFEFYIRVDSKKVKLAAMRVRLKIEHMLKHIPTGLRGQNRPWRLAYQYDILCAYANLRLDEGQTVELCIEKNTTAVTNCPSFARIESNKVAEQGTDPDLFYMFKNISLPVIDMLKDEIRDAFKSKYPEYFPLIWWCYQPIDGKPCGECFTCVGYIKEGITDVFDEEALARYKLYADKEAAEIERQSKEIELKRRETLERNGQ